MWVFVLLFSNLPKIQQYISKLNIKMHTKTLHHAQVGLIPGVIWKLVNMIHFINRLKKKNQMILSINVKKNLLFEKYPTHFQYKILS